MDVFGLGTTGMKMAERSLDFTARSALLNSSNIANSDTPGYKAKDIEFNEVMRNALESSKGGFPNAGSMVRTDPAHLPVTSFDKLQPKVISPQSPTTLNGNNVNLDREMTKLNENTINNAIYSKIVSKEIEKLRLAIAE